MGTSVVRSIEASRNNEDTGFDLAARQAHREVGDEVVLGLAGAMRGHDTLTTPEVMMNDNDDE